MPSPAIYVVAIVAGVAAGYAFKEFVYDPHLAPKIERWAEAYAAYRRDRQMRRARPQSHSRVRLDDEDVERKVKGESSTELESLVGREMQSIKLGGILTHRKGGNSSRDGLEMIETVSVGNIQPNCFLPFEPLSPARAPSASPVPNTFVSDRDAALPVGFVPGLVSDGTLRSASMHYATLNESTAASPVHSTAPPGPSFHPLSELTRTESPLLSSEPVILAPRPRAPSRLATEYDFVRHTSENDARDPHELTVAFPISISRTTTPFTDMRSEVSFDFMGSDFGSLDVEVLGPVDGEFASSPTIGGVHDDDNVDFLGAPQVDVRSDVGSEEWEHVSDAGR